MKLKEILVVEFYEIDQLLIVCCEFVRYLIKNGSIVGQCISYL